MANSEAATPTGGDLNAGKVVTFGFTTGEAVTAAGSSLTLSNDATAVFDAADSTSTHLVYRYTVASGDTNTTDLQARALDGTITDRAGNTLDTATFAAIDTADQVDTTRPSSTAVADSGTGIDASGNGDLDAGRTVTLTVSTSGPVYVIPGSNRGTPTLTLSDGATAIYTGPTSIVTSTLTFTYTVAVGQDAAALTVSSVNANGATVTDRAGNPISTSLMGATVPSGTLTVDTAPPTASSPTLTAAQNAAATPIGITAPTDNLTAAGALVIVAGTLPTDGTVTLGDGTTAVTTGEALTAGQLTDLEFTPTPGISSQGSTFTYSVTDGAGNATQGQATLNVGAAGAPTIAGTHATTETAEATVSSFTPTAGQANSTTTTTFSILDTSSVGGAATAPDTVPSVVDTDPAVATTVTGGGVTTTTQNAPVHPFTTAAVADANANSSDTLSIQVQGAGALSGAGLGGGTDGLYVLSGSAGQVTGELQGLTFTPAANGPGTTTTTTFALTDITTAGPSATNSGTSVVDTVASPATDTVSISPSVSFKNGVFTLTGTASSTAGVRSVEISAVENCGARVDLGTATVNADGTFTFGDRIGANLQGFPQATVTDNAGGTATSADPLFSLTGGLGRDYGAGRQRRYTADGDGFTADTRFRPDGTKSVTVLGQGQTFASAYDDTFNNAKQADTTFVFDPGFGLDVVNGFRLGGDGHDTLSFKGSDFGTTPQAQLGALLSNSYNAGGSLTITDPTSGDAVQLKGITKAQLVHNEKDIRFR